MEEREPDNVHKKGFLMKRSDHIHDWRPRYFILRGTSLEYYKRVGPCCLRPSKIMFTLPPSLSGADIIYPYSDVKPIKTHTFMFRVAFPAESKHTELIMAAEAGSVAQQWVDCLKISTGRLTPTAQGLMLYQAVIDRKKDVVRTYLAQGISPSFANPNPGVPYQGAQEIVSMLINAGADMSATDDQGYTALHYACTARHHDVMEALIKAGASLHLGDQLGQTPLHLGGQAGRRGRRAGDTGMALCMLSFPAAPHRPFVPGPGLRARGHPGVQLLLKAGARPNERSKNAHPHPHPAHPNWFLWVLAPGERGRDNEKDLFQLLLRYGADMNLPDALGDTPLQISMEAANHKRSLALVRLGANVNMISEKERNGGPLHLLTRLGPREDMDAFRELIKEILGRGVGADQRDDHGRTALHVAVCIARPAVVDLLLEYAAKGDLDATDVDGATPLALARRHRYGSAVMQLVRAGAPEVTGDWLAHISAEHEGPWWPAGGRRAHGNIVKQVTSDEYAAQASRSLQGARGAATAGGPDRTSDGAPAAVHSDAPGLAEVVAMVAEPGDTVWCLYRSGRLVGFDSQTLVQKETFLLPPPITLDASITTSLLAGPAASGDDEALAAPPPVNPASFATTRSPSVVPAAFRSQRPAGAPQNSLNPPYGVTDRLACSRLCVFAHMAWEKNLWVIHHNGARSAIKQAGPTSLPNLPFAADRPSAVTHVLMAPIFVPGEAAPSMPDLGPAMPRPLATPASVSSLLASSFGAAPGGKPAAGASKGQEVDLRPAPGGFRSQAVAWSFGRFEALAVASSDEPVRRFVYPDDSAPVVASTTATTPPPPSFRGWTVTSVTYAPPTAAQLRLQAAQAADYLKDHPALPPNWAAPAALPPPPSPSPSPSPPPPQSPAPPTTPAAPGSAGGAPGPSPAPPPAPTPAPGPDPAGGEAAPKPEEDQLPPLFAGLLWLGTDRGSIEIVDAQMGRRVGHLEPVLSVDERLLSPAISALVYVPPPPPAPPPAEQHPAGLLASSASAPLSSSASPSLASSASAPLPSGGRRPPTAPSDSAAAPLPRSQIKRPAWVEVIPAIAPTAMAPPSAHPAAAPAQPPPQPAAPEPIGPPPPHSFGEVWVASPYFGIRIFDAQDMSLLQTIVIPAAQGILAMDFCPASGRVWACTFNGDLLAFNARRKV
ncbi:hypothetical protein PAPYR_2006 [Paratrimastix pyriformis]|uniref:PH domain-containing protein n=1 Tax=Paratrimastix pyriformis TaxID=342808 RepID=A0ABQ8USC6_9EUKA|nr:hypothetical protein PAPYR_2006 [Paratrimastix pyriformis]